jgi:hypothetical protein
MFIYLIHEKFKKLKCIYNYIICIRTLSLELSDVCMVLYFVPRLFTSHTSNPLSAKINPNDSSGEFNNHTIPS